MLLNLAILFISITIVIQFFGSFVDVIQGDAQATDFIETIWNALVLLAWGIIIRNLF